MATVAFFAPIGAGHVNPTLGLAAELVRRGHRVTYATTEANAARVAETGAEIVPWTSAWDALSLDDVPQMHGKGLVKAMGLLLGETRSALAQLGAGERPDLVVHDGPLCWWGRILAHRWQVPSVETWPNLVSNEHWSMQRRYTTVNPLSFGFLRVVLRLGALLRKEGIGDVQGFMRGDRAAVRLVLLPRAFQYAGETFGEGYAFVGPGLTERSYQGGWQPPGDSPVALVSLGTGYNNRPGFYRAVIGGAAGLPWHVVLAVGGVDPAALGPIPPNVEVHAHVPQLAVLRRARVFVTHAGMGSTMESLHFGVPMVAVPQMAEQRANADRIAELGLGRALPDSGLTGSQVWDAAEEVAADPRVRERLDWMRGEIAEAGGAPAAADEVEKVLNWGS
ncbi:MGT family glycosyltransferase [Nonomuraea thailandensis]|uniref:MGT family glycosyltransferase n=1 Tax=Nonomuraea thailandensis TaxID=1188745 RepID=A0A9X2GH03_9ACTN|nr:macrolide family glycosyltransferase [Nonomuraea thailandensis]MCP2358949.1 MGT family glycosyltransferase [Nonomuraea thailandensis]